MIPASQKGVGSMQPRYERTGSALAIAALALLLSGCDAAWITVDLGTDPPADPEISAVQVNLLGLEFRKGDSTTTTLEFRDGELVDLLDLRDAEPLRLFTNEELPVGTYTGVRLLFDPDQDQSRVTTSDGDTRLRLAAGAFAAVSFTVEDEKESREEFTLMLDLRQSLSFDEANDRYTLTPALRSVRTEDAARIEGNVSVVCPVGTVLRDEGAIYLYSGRNVQADDLDGAEAEPFATTGVIDSGTAAFRYALRFLPAGNYTLAFTCQGDEEVPGSSENLDFRNVENVEVDAGDVLQWNLD
ncbi:MAG: hypothetical protein QG550_1188 [Pseudomonadota bacterium]|nr:hypothetical protein [Pseudomonadota bacterium]